MAKPSDRPDLAAWVDERLATLETDDQWQPNVSTAITSLEERRRGFGQRGHRWTWAAAAAAAAGVCLLFPSTQIFAQRCVEACVAQSSRVTQLLWRSSPAVHGSSPLIPSDERTLAPDFNLRDRTGEPVSLAGYHGRVVLLNFWATWCPPCQAEMPWFAEFERQYRDRGLVVVGVSMDEDGWSAVAPFLDAHAVSYPVVLGDEAIRHAYGDLGALPATFIIDRTGRVASRRVGLVGRADYDADLRSLLGE